MSDNDDLPPCALGERHSASGNVSRCAVSLTFVACHSASRIDCMAPVRFTHRASPRPPLHRATGPLIHPLRSLTGGCPRRDGGIVID